MRNLPVDTAVLKLYKNVDFSSDYSGTDERTETTNPDHAQVISSEIRHSMGPFTWGGQHFVLLDLDVPAHLYPSTTPGHSHLYIEVPITWQQYEPLLNMLADLGVLEPGFVKVSKKRKATMLRLPWIKKEKHEPQV